MVTVTINSPDRKKFHDVPRGTWFIESRAGSTNALYFKFTGDQFYAPKQIPPVSTPGTLVAIDNFNEVKPILRISCNYSPPISFGHIRVGDAFLFLDELYVKIDSKQGLYLSGYDSDVFPFVDSDLVLPVDLEITTWIDVSVIK